MHTVDSPEIVVEVGRGSGGHPLVAGDSLTLTCHVTVTQKGMSDGVTMSVEWFKGEENEEIKSASVIDVHDKEIGSYTFEHSFEALSTEDSNTYKCEASLWFQTIGLLATASHSMDITVQGKAICLVLCIWVCLKTIVYLLCTCRTTGIWIFPATVFRSRNVQRVEGNAIP